MDYSQDHYPPSTPTLTCETMPMFNLDTFEANTGQWRNHRGDVFGARITQVVRDQARGDHALRLDAMRVNSLLSALAVERDYDLTKYPVICFDYLISTYTRVNLQVLVNGQWYEVLMTSPKAAYANIGKLDVKADGKWHVCAFDLLALVQKAQPNVKTYTVSQVTFGDMAQTGNKEDAYFMVDNFMVAGYGAADAQFTWQARDVTGIAGYSVVFSPDPEAACEKTVTTKEAKGVFKAAQSGMHYLRVRASDSAGNWSDTASYPYYVK